MRSVILALCILLSLENTAQKLPATRENDILFRTSIVRNIDMRWEGNKKLFGRENQLLTFLLKTASEGNLPIFDPLTGEELSYDKLTTRLQYPFSDSSGEAVTPQQLSIELCEDLFFDSQRSVPDYKIKSLTIYIPAAISHRGIHEPIARFSFEDCMKAFANHREECKARTAAGKSIGYTEVFLLHMYNSEIVKIGHEDDPYFDQGYCDPVKAFLVGKSKEQEIADIFYKLMNPK